MSNWYILAYGHMYVALSGPTPAHGYEYVAVASKALAFTTQFKAQDFVTESGPGWAKDLHEKGLLRIMQLVDGKAEPV